MRLATLFILMFVVQVKALPCGLIRATRSHDNRVDECLANPEKCQEEDRTGQQSPKVLMCLNSCANCVTQWQAGVYNGRMCALDCIQQVENLADSLDPDCNLIKYFNSTVLASTN